jgi:hypothetical protein
LEGQTLKIFKSLAIGASLAFLLSTALLAHHSTNDIYDESKTVQISGKVVAWRLVNPHPYLTIEVVVNGKAERWDLSFGGSAAAPLKRQGYTPETFKIGEIINARGNPALKDGKGLLIRGGVTRQDGTRIP